MAPEYLAEVIPDITEARYSPQIQRHFPAVEAWRPTPFDRLDEGVVIVDGNFGITFANHAAHELLAEGDGVRQGNDGIAAGTQAATLALRRVIAGGRSGGNCQLPRAGGRALLSVLAVPLRSHAACNFGSGHATILFLADPDRGHHQRADTLGRQFALTRAESAFLVEIVKGDGLQAAAGRRGVSLATARICDTSSRRPARDARPSSSVWRQLELMCCAMSSLGTMRTGGETRPSSPLDEASRGDPKPTCHSPWFMRP
jgi:hypothetical protein